MRSAVGSVAAVFAGFIVASIVMMIVETINGRVLYPELAKAAEGVTDRESIRALFATAPLGSLLVVIGGWVVASVAGGWTTSRLAARAKAGHGLVLGLVLTLAGIANNLMLPPPLWFWIASLGVLMPAAYLGAPRVASPRRPSRGSAGLKRRSRRPKCVPRLEQ